MTDLPPPGPDNAQTPTPDQVQGLGAPDVTDIVRRGPSVRTFLVVGLVLLAIYLVITH
jgi:hypothetical protein